MKSIAKFVFFMTVSVIATHQLKSQELKLVKNAGHADRASSIDFSTDGKYLLTKGGNLTLIWHLNSRRVVKSMEGIGDPIFLNDSYDLLIQSKDGFSIYDPIEEKTQLTFQVKYRDQSKGIYTNDQIYKKAISPDNRWMAIVDSKKKITVWDLSNGSFKFKFDAGLYGYNYVRHISIDPTSQYIIALGDAGLMRTWSLETGKLLVYKGNSDHGFNTVTDCEFITDSTALITGFYTSAASVRDPYTYHNSVSIWNMRTLTKIKDLVGSEDKNEKKYLDVAVSADQQYFAVSNGLGKHIKVWQISDQQEVMSFDVQEFSDVYFSPGSNILLVNDKDVKLYDVDKRESIGNLSNMLSSAHSMSLHPNQNEVIVAYQNGVVKQWDMEVGKINKTFSHDQFIWKVQYSPSGKSFVAGGQLSSDYKGQNKIYHWRLSNEQLIKEFYGHKNDVAYGITGLDISSDGKYLISGVQGSIKKWSMATGKLIASHKIANPYDVLEPVNHLQFSPRNQEMIWLDISQVRRWGSSGKTANWNLGSRGRNSQFAVSHSNSNNGDYYVATYEPKQEGVWPPIVGIKLWGRAKEDYRILDTKMDKVWGVAFSKNDKWVATAGKDKMVLMDVASGEIVKTLTGDTDNVGEIHFSNDNKRLYTAGGPGIISVWDIEKGKQTVFLESLGNGKEYYAYNEEGYYTGTKQINQYVYYSKGLDIVNIDQFDLQYNRPDIILEGLGLASPAKIRLYKKAYEKRLKKMGIDPSVFDIKRNFNIPEISLSSDINSFASVKSRDFKFSISAEDKLYNITRLMVHVNGVPIYGIKGKTLDPATDIASDIILELNSGSNVIEVEVMNEKGVMSSRERFEINFENPGPSKPDLHLIAIGVSSFQQSDYNLTYADKDAKDLIGLMSSSDTYANVYVHEFTNELATSKNILKIRTQLEKSSVDDEVILFVASHGLLDEELDYYIAMHDTDFENPAKGGLKYEDLESLLDGIPARNKLILIDACHSGEVDKDDSELITAKIDVGGGVKSRGFKTLVSKSSGLDLQSSFELMKELFADLRRNNGAVVISSASGQEFAFESSEWKNGVFTYALIEGLKSGNTDLDKNGITKVSELRSYVGSRVKSLTKGKQNPTSRTENIENDFAIW